jgi:hypothetical protein
MQKVMKSIQSVLTINSTNIMADKITLICPSCQTQFEFDPNSDEQVITSLNKNFRPKLKSNVEVVAYLECPNGHLKPYKVKKDYK